MKTVIIEDEKLTAERLGNILTQEFPQIELVKTLHSAGESITWLNENDDPDLILMDIELGDGTSFDVLDNTQIKSKIIFTTAYDEYAIKAFKYNSIDYLLKPLDKEELKLSIDNFKSQPDEKENISEMLNEIKRFFKKEYKSRFLVKIGEKLIPVSTEEIAYIYSEDGYSFIKHKTGKKYILDKSLDEIINQLNPQLFFRLNRKFIGSLSSINTITPYFNARLKVELTPKYEEAIIISREKVKSFKYWLDN